MTYILGQHHTGVEGGSMWMTSESLRIVQPPDHMSTKVASHYSLTSNYSIHLPIFLIQLYKEFDAVSAEVIAQEKTA